MEIEIDNYPVADLPSRFDLGKQAVYNRLEALGIKPTKVGKRSYISATQLQTLDRIHAHINQGGSMADFQSPPQSPDLEISPLDAMDALPGVRARPVSGILRTVVRDSSRAARRLFRDTPTTRAQPLAQLLHA